MSLGVGVGMRGRNRQTVISCTVVGWGKAGGRAELQGKVKVSVCPWHRAKMSQRRQLESKVVGKNHIPP